jgi:hypothetical protein
VAVKDEWARWSARIHGLINACSVSRGLAWRASESSGAMKYLRAAAVALYEELDDFSHKLDPAESKVRIRIIEAVKYAKPFLSDSANALAETHLNTALTALILAEGEISFLLSNNQEVIRSRTERAFAHLQRSIAVDAELRAKETLIYP